MRLASPSIHPPAFVIGKGDFTGEAEQFTEPERLVRLERGPLVSSLLASPDLPCVTQLVLAFLHDG